MNFLSSLFTLCYFFLVPIYVIVHVHVHVGHQLTMIRSTSVEDNHEHSDKDADSYNCHNNHHWSNNGANSDRS